MPKASRRLNSILIIKIITVMMFLLIIGVIVMTSLFISRQLGTSTAVMPDSSSTDKSAVEVPDVTLLGNIEAQLKTKVQRPLPNADEMRNPFLIPAVRQPAPEPPPAPAQPAQPEPPPVQ